MAKLDRLVIDAMAEKVFTPERLRGLLREHKVRLKAAQNDNAGQIDALKKELEELQMAADELYEAVEKGILPLNASLQDLAHKLQARRHMDD